jgi:hypothetical protein
MAAVDDVVTAFNGAGWKVLKQESVHGGRSVNPTRVDLARGKQYLKLVVYAWKITGEGKGRAGSNYRIQATRSHDGDLIIEPPRLTLGFGVDAERSVLAAFDGWSKRAKGSSTSVHIKRETLELAAATGYAEQSPPWDSWAAVRLNAVEPLLNWIARQRDRRLTAVHPVDYEVSGSAARVTCDLWDAAPASWLRPRDHLVLVDADGHRLVDESIWEITDLAIAISKPSRNARRAVTFGCRRYGRIHTSAAAPVLRELTGRSVD